MSIGTRTTSASTLTRTRSSDGFGRRLRSTATRSTTPMRMAALEPEIRAFAAECLDPLVGEGGFDFVADLGALVPMQVIGMLLGIPEADQRTIRDEVNASLRTEPGQH